MSPPGPTGIRVNRYLAARGLASRRGADRMVEEGRVRVGGRVAALGDVVDPTRDRVTVDGRPVPAALPVRTLLLNKPTGYVSTRSDPGGRPTVLDLIEDATGLFPVGRLDIDSRGLLLLTTDGDLALRLTHPRHGIEKTYRVSVSGRVTERAMRRLLHGVELEDGPARVLRARLLETGPGGDVLDVVMGEGRRREVRRLLKALDLPVRDLQRTALGPLHLGRLHEGTARPLTAAEARSLYEAVDLPAPTRARRSPAALPPAAPAPSGDRRRAPRREGR